jgi:hypothetical protein
MSRPWSSVPRTGSAWSRRPFQAGGRRASLSSSVARSNGLCGATQLANTAQNMQISATAARHRQRRLSESCSPHRHRAMRASGWGISWGYAAWVLLLNLHPLERQGMPLSATAPRRCFSSRPSSAPAGAAAGVPRRPGGSSCLADHGVALGLVGLGLRSCSRQFIHLGVAVRAQVELAASTFVPGKHKGWGRARCARPRCWMSSPAGKSWCHGARSWGSRCPWSRLPG